MSLWMYILLFAAPFIGGITALQTGYKNEILLKTFLAFAGGYIFSITILNVLPEVFVQHNSYTSLLILAGFFFQIMIGSFSEGAEHGHLHTHKHNHNLALPLGLFLSLSIHAFTEGIPLGFISGINKILVFGIALHELPAAFALMSILQTEHINKKMVLVLLTVYALMSPAGALIGNTMRFQFSEIVFNNILAFVAGIFLYISTTILFENSENHLFSFRKLIAVLGGVVLAICMSFLM
ncbi:MAG: ZIP family metal transporter [Bacteroidota bacterium]